MTSADLHASIEERVWSIPGRGARLLVDLDTIESNVRAIARHISPTTNIMAIVKAGGYGHGGPQVAETAVDGGATCLGVATVDEGIELRRHGIEAPILVLGPSMPQEAAAASADRLHITIGARHQVAAIAAEADAAFSGFDTPLGVHLKINTGMNRFGVNPSEAIATAQEISQSGMLSLDGVFTHFACADEPDPSVTHRQSEVFTRCLDDLGRAGLMPGQVHVSNSAAILRFREFDFDLVRPGIGMYGIAPAPEVALFPGMRPALKIVASVQRLERIEAGQSVGYGGTFEAAAGVQIGLLPLGYGDGYPRSLSNRAWVGHGGARLPLAGRVSMDQMTVCIPSDADLSLGDTVTVVGDGGAGEPTVEDIAALAGTIPYEVLTGLGVRLPTDYHRSGVIVARDNTAGDRSGRV
jgi:alanine racemase